MDPALHRSLLGACGHTCHDDFSLDKETCWKDIPRESGRQASGWAEPGAAAAAAPLPPHPRAPSTGSQSLAGPGCGWETGTRSEELGGRRLPARLLKTYAQMSQLRPSGALRPSQGSWRAAQACSHQTRMGGVGIIWNTCPQSRTMRRPDLVSESPRWCPVESPCAEHHGECSMDAGFFPPLPPSS